MWSHILYVLTSIFNEYIQLGREFCYIPRKGSNEIGLGMSAFDGS